MKRLKLFVLTLAIPLVLLAALSVFAQIGELWTSTLSDQIVSFEDGTDDDATIPMIAIDDLDRIHVVWQQWVGAHQEIFYSRSEDGGQSWSGTAADRAISFNNGQGAQLTDVAAAGSDTLHVVWHEDAGVGQTAIYYSRSSDGGATWTGATTDTIISNQNDGMPAYSPALVTVGSSQVHVVWQETYTGTAEYEIHHAVSTDSGATWSSTSGDQEISFYDGRTTQYPDIAADPSGNLHVVWQEVNTNRVEEIHYSHSTDSGATWSGTVTDTIVSFPDNQDAGPPAVVADPDGNLHAVWAEIDTDILNQIREIHYSRSTDGGDTWSGQTADEIVSFPDGQTARDPAIAVDPSGNLHVFWYESTGSHEEIHYSYSTDGGATWSGASADGVISFDDGNAAAPPAAAADSRGYLHMVWDEAGATAAEIHYGFGMERRASSARFTDAGGTDVITYTTEGDNVYVTVTDDNHDRNISGPDSITVVVTTTVGDQETFTLTETGDATGVFRNTTGFPTNMTENVQAGNDTLEVVHGLDLGVTYTDAYDADDVSTDAAVYGTPTDSTVDFVDAGGTPTAAYEIGDTVYVEVDDPDENIDQSSAQTVDVTLTVADTGDSETITLTETGNDTGLFRGSIDTYLRDTPTSDNDLLEVVAAAQVSASYTDDENADDTASDTAVVGSLSDGTVEFDAATYDIGDLMAVTMDDADENTNADTAQTVVVTLTVADTGDSETVTLTETGNDTGLFQGSVETYLSDTPTADDGRVEVVAASEVSASYTDDNDPTDTASDAAVVGSLSDGAAEFTNADGVSIAEYVMGQTVYVTVDDADENTNADTLQTVTATVTVTDTGDSETLTLTETGDNTGIFRGGIDTSLNDTPTVENGALEAVMESEIAASYTDADDPTDTASDAAVVGSSSDSVASFDQASYSVGDTLTVTVDDADENTNAGTTQTVAATVTVADTGDSETVTLTETGPNTGAFAATLPTVRSATSTADNGTLEVVEASEVQLNYTDDDDPGDSSSDAATVGALTDATVAFDAEAYNVGDTVTVTVNDADENDSQYSPQTVVVTLNVDTTGDVETLTLTETGNDTGRFQGSISTELSDSPTADGSLQVIQGSQLTASYVDADDASDTASDSAPVGALSAGAVGFTDAGMTPVASYTTGETVYVRVVDADQNTHAGSKQTVDLTITVDATGDIETLTLTETELNSGVFFGNLPSASRSSADSGNGELEVQHDATLTADYTDGSATATVQGGKIFLPIVLKGS